MRPDDPFSRAGNLVVLGGPDLALRVHVTAAWLSWRSARVAALIISARNQADAVIAARAFGLEEDGGRGIVPARDLVTGSVNGSFQLGPGETRTFAVPARILMAVIEDVAKCRSAVVYDRLNHPHRSPAGELGSALSFLMRLVMNGSSVPG
jgi:hypothetical protein